MRIVSILSKLPKTGVLLAVRPILAILRWKNPKKNIEFLTKIWALFFALWPYRHKYRNNFFLYFLWPIHQSLVNCPAAPLYSLRVFSFSNVSRVFMAAVAFLNASFAKWHVAYAIWHIVSVLRAGCLVQCQPTKCDMYEE